MNFSYNLLILPSVNWVAHKRIPASCTECEMVTKFCVHYITIRESGSTLLFILYYLPIRSVDPVYSLYKEGSDRTIFGPIQATAVHWSGVMSKLWYMFCV